MRRGRSQRAVESAEAPARVTPIRGDANLRRRASSRPRPLASSRPRPPALRGSLEGWRRRGRGGAGACASRFDLRGGGQLAISRGLRAGGVGRRPGGWRSYSTPGEEKAPGGPRVPSLSFPLPSALRLLRQPALRDLRDPAGPAHPRRRDSRREVNAGGAEPSPAAEDAGRAARPGRLGSVAEPLRVRAPGRGLAPRAARTPGPRRQAQAASLRAAPARGRGG